MMVTCWGTAAGCDGESGENRAPIANAGADQQVAPGAQVTLDGSKSSDPDGDPLTFKWTISKAPSASTAQLSSATVAKPTFTPAVNGSYEISLVVKDGTFYFPSEVYPHFGIKPFVAAPKVVR